MWSCFFTYPCCKSSRRILDTLQFIELNYRKCCCKNWSNECWSNEWFLIRPILRIAIEEDLQNILSIMIPRFGFDQWTIHLQLTSEAVPVSRNRSPGRLTLFTPGLLIIQHVKHSSVILIYATVHVFTHLSFFHYHDSVRIHDCIQTMCYCQHSTFFKCFPNCFLYFSI